MPGSHYGVEYSATIHNSSTLPKLQPWLPYDPLPRFLLLIVRVATCVISAVELVEACRSGMVGGGHCSGCRAGPKSPP